MPNQVYLAASVSDLEANLTQQPKQRLQPLMASPYEWELFMQRRFSERLIALYTKLGKAIFDKGHLIESDNPTAAQYAKMGDLDMLIKNCEAQLDGQPSLEVCCAILSYTDEQLTDVNPAVFQHDHPARRYKMPVYIKTGEVVGEIPVFALNMGNFNTWFANVYLKAWGDNPNLVAQHPWEMLEEAKQRYKATVFGAIQKLHEQGNGLFALTECNDYMKALCASDEFKKQFGEKYLLVSMTDPQSSDGDNLHFLVNTELFMILDRDNNTDDRIQSLLLKYIGPDEKLKGAVVNVSSIHGRYNNTPYSVENAMMKALQAGQERVKRFDKTANALVGDGNTRTGVVSNPVPRCAWDWNGLDSANKTQVDSADLGIAMNPNGKIDDMRYATIDPLSGEVVDELNPEAVADIVQDPSIQKNNRMLYRLTGMGFAAMQAANKDALSMSDFQSKYLHAVLKDENGVNVYPCAKDYGQVDSWTFQCGLMKKVTKKDEHGNPLQDESGDDIKEPVFDNASLELYKKFQQLIESNEDMKSIFKVGVVFDCAAKGLCYTISFDHSPKNVALFQKTIKSLIPQLQHKTVSGEVVQAGVSAASAAGKIGAFAQPKDAGKPEEPAVAAAMPGAGM